MHSQPKDDSPRAISAHRSASLDFADDDCDGIWKRADVVTPVNAHWQRGLGATSAPKFGRKEAAGGYHSFSLALSLSISLCLTFSL